VGRIFPTGQVTEFPIPSHESGPHAIVEGREGDAWFAEYFADKVGRVTPSGQITEFPVPQGTRPYALAVDGEGNIWFTGLTSTSIGRMSPDGTVTQFPLPSGMRAGALTVGPDGRIWFTEETRPPNGEITRAIGRITPTGRYSEVSLPNAASDPVDVITGAEGNVWYAAMGEGPCEGGGGACLLWEPKNPAIVGRIMLAPLRTAIAVGRTPVWPNRVEVPLSCSEGTASETCRGSIEVKIRGKRVARSRYTVPIDSSRRAVVKRIARVPSLRKVTAKRHRALIVVRPDTGGRLRRGVNLSPRH
jgi:hypothetical protein